MPMEVFHNYVVKVPFYTDQYTVVQSLYLLPGQKGNIEAH